MKKLILPLIALTFAGSAFAQQITFRAEQNEVSLRGTLVDRTNYADLNLGGIGFFVPAADFASFVANPVWNVQDPLSITVEELGAILEFVTSRSGFQTAGAITRPPVGAPAGAGVLTSTLNPGAAGFHPVFIIHDSATGAAGLREGSNLGIVASTTTSAAAGTEVIAFNTAGRWDTYLLGTSGSIQLATVIPEPSTYAALFGIFALAGVMIRRRLRK